MKFSKSSITLIVLVILLQCQTALATKVSRPEHQPRNERSLELIKNLKSPKTDSFSFVVVGDSRTYPKRFARISELINSLKPDFVIHLGDIVTTGVAKEYDEVEPIFDSINAPVLSTPGNHDFLKEGKNRSANFEKYFGSGDITFDVGGMRFILIDNARAYITKAQLAKLQEDLNCDKVRAVFMHVPPAGPYPKHNFEGGAKDLLRILEDTKCEFAFFGHIHAYDYRKIAGNCNAYISGGGGAELNGQGLYKEIFHVLHVTVNQRKVEVKMIPLPAE